MLSAAKHLVAHRDRPFASLRVTTGTVLTFGLVFNSHMCYTQPVPFKGIYSYPIICRGRFIAPTADSSAIGGYFVTLHYPFNPVICRGRFIAPSPIYRPS
jgi:hypothetical protein